MLGQVVSLPLRVVRIVGALPGRLEAIERSTTDMAKLLAVAVERLERLETIEGLTEGMHGQLARIEHNTADLNDHTQGLGDNTARLVRIAQPLERMGRRRGLRRRPVNGTGEAAGADLPLPEDEPTES